MDVQLPTFIPLSEAARRLGLSVDTLTGMIESGRMKAATLPDGAVVVPESELSEAVTREQFQHLRGQEITISAAAERYDVPGITIRGWVARGLVQKMPESRYPTHIDEADMAYCAAVYRAQGGRRGARIFDEDGQPYQLKHTWLAEYRKQKKQANSGARPSVRLADSKGQGKRKE